MMFYVDIHCTACRALQWSSWQCPTCAYPMIVSPAIQLASVSAFVVMSDDCKAKHNWTASLTHAGDLVASARHDRLCFPKHLLLHPPLTYTAGRIAFVLSANWFSIMNLVVFLTPQTSMRCWWCRVLFRSLQLAGQLFSIERQLFPFLWDNDLLPNGDIKLIYLRFSWETLQTCRRQKS